MPQDDVFYDSRTQLNKHFEARSGQLAMRAESLSQLEHWAGSARSVLWGLLGLDRMTPAPHQAQMTESTDAGDHIREHWIMHTEPHVILPFYILRPKGTKCPLPTVLCPHGHGWGGKAAVAGVIDDPVVAKAVEKPSTSYGLDFVRAGFLTICPDSRGFGQRRELECRDNVLKNSCHHLQLMGAPLGIPVAGMQVFDLMRLMDYVVSLPEVRTNAVGCAGLSGGGMQTLYFSALDQRVLAAVISGYFYGVRQSLLELPANCMCNMIPHLWEYFDMGDIGALIAPRPLIIETGNQDRLNGAGGVDNVLPQVKTTRRAYELYGASDRLVHDIFVGPHCWNGKKALPFMKKMLVVSTP